MAFGDPWSEEQSTLADILMLTWHQRQRWPIFQFVASELAQRGVTDTAAVLKSFPTLGIRHPTLRSYCDVFYDHTFPTPRDDSEVSLSVSGLSRHEKGLEIAQAYVAVLNYAAQKYARTPMDPVVLVEVEISSEELAASRLAWWPEHALHAAGVLIKREWPLGVQYLGGDPDEGTWRIRVGRDVLRYRDVNVDGYVDLIKQDIETAASAYRHLYPQTTAGADSEKPEESTGVVRGLGMDPQPAVAQPVPAASTPTEPDGGPPSTITLDGTEWHLGEPIGDRGGFGQVFAATNGGCDAVLKLIPKVPGADRELLFANLDDARHVVPVMSSGEWANNWVLLMPRARYSLRQRLAALGGRMSLAEAVLVLEDVAATLSDLTGRVVHRDLKPENVLFLDGHWCLADFGIARYAEATTDPFTHKYSMTPPYAAPEQWRLERATAATDIYALGIIAYELIAGHRPFPGPSHDDFRDQHLDATPAELADVPLAVASLINECLYKAPEARPLAADFARRLHTALQPTPSGGLGRLRQLHAEQVQRRATDLRDLTAAEYEEQRRRSLMDAARQGFQRISDNVRLSLASELPDAPISAGQRPGGWELAVGQARLTLDGLQPEPVRSGLPFDVVASGSLTVVQPGTRSGYIGRSHALWYGDVQQDGQYLWFEVAFMTSPLMASVRSTEPYALRPAEAVAAIGPGMTSVQLGWPFTPQLPESLAEFIDRWAGWLASAADNDLQLPTRMPERDPAGSWRTR